MEIYQRIIEFLDFYAIKYQTIEHEPTITSEASAAARGESLNIGAKALLLKTDNAFILTIIPANRKLDTKKIKRIYNSKNLRFASPEELMQFTGCPKGAVPPFGFLFQIEMIVDKSLFEEEWMAFNAGSLTTSVKMKTEDYQRFVKPKTGEFSSV